MCIHTECRSVLIQKLSKVLSTLFYQNIMWWTLSPFDGCGTLVLYIVWTKPMSDLCWQCQKNNSAIYKSANLTEAEKSVCVCITKWLNAVVSFLDNFFTRYGMGEKHLELYCDNCPGQNRNNTMLQYLLWRVLHGFQETVSLNFLIVCHTKFVPDWAFGLVKQTYHWKMISCLDNVVKVVRSSTQTGVKISQLVGQENREVFVKQRDWQSFLKPVFQTFPGITQHQHYGCVIW